MECWKSVPLQRIEMPCCICGKTVLKPPYIASISKFPTCSPACRQQVKPIFNPVTREKLATALKAKWASGTRTPMSPEGRAKAAQSLRKGYRDGLHKITHMTPELARLTRSRMNQETERRLADHLRELGMKKRGTRNPPGPSACGVENHKAKYWSFKAPGNIRVEGWNLNEIVRTHSDLFNPADLACKNSSGKCRATQGLRSLFQKPSKANGWQDAPSHWKGWVAVDKHSRYSAATIFRSSPEAIARAEHDVEMATGETRACAVHR